MAIFDFMRKAKPVRSEGDEPDAPMYIGGHPVRLLSSKAMVAEAAVRQVPQLFRITNFVASAVQSVPWYCEPDPDLLSSERATPNQIKPINALLKSPNDTSTSQQFQYWLALNLLLYSRAHFKVGVGMTGPNGLYPLAAKFVSGILNNRGTVDYYEYGQGEQKTRLPTRRMAEKKGDTTTSYAAEISFPSISGLVEYNKTPAAIESLSQPLQIIVALMQRALDTASGHPNVKYVITAEKTLTRAQRAALERHLVEAGPDDEYSGTILFLYNTAVQVHMLDNKLGDIHSKIPMDDMTRQIAGVYGVPIALLGLGSSDAAKYSSNYNESRLSFWQDTIVPSYLTPIAAGMTQAICPPGARITFDLDQVPALWEGRASLGVKLTKTNFLTTTEKRAILGFGPDNNLPELIPVSGGEPAQDNTDTTDDLGNVALDSDDTLDKIVPIHGRP